MQKHGDDAEYPAREVQPRYLREVRDSDSPHSQRLYKQQLRIWELEKKERQSKKKQDGLQQAMEQAWADLEDARLLEQMKEWEELYGSGNKCKD